MIFDFDPHDPVPTSNVGMGPSKNRPAINLLAHFIMMGPRAIELNPIVIKSGVIINWID